MYLKVKAYGASCLVTGMNKIHVDCGSTVQDKLMSHTLQLLHTDSGIDRGKRIHRAMYMTIHVLSLQVHKCITLSPFCTRCAVHVNA